MSTKLNGFKFKFNSSIKHQLFVYIQLNDQTVLFQTIQFSMSTQFKCQTSIWPIDKTLPLRARVDLGVIAMMKYSALMALHHQII